MKKILSLLLAVLFLTSVLPICARAATVHLVDEAGLLSTEEASIVETKLAQISSAIGMDVLVRTANSLGGKEAWTFAEESMNAEYGNVSDGILFLVSMDEYVWSVAKCGKGVTVFTDSAVDTIAGEFLSELNAKNYAVGFSLYGDAVLNYYQSIEPEISGFSGKYIIDGAGLLTNDEALAVEEKLEQASEKIGMKVLIRTTYSLGSKTSMEFADDTMDYDYGDVSDGMLFLIAMEYRDWYVSTKGKAIGLFDDDAIDSIVDSFIDKIKDAEYKDAFIKYGNSVVKRYNYATSTFHFDFMSIGVPLVVALIIAAVVVGMWKAQLKSARFHDAGMYLKQGSLVLTQKVDLFLYTTVTKTVIQSESSSGGGGSHTSSSGSSHGGHGGKF